MPIDVITLKAVATELNGLLTGGRIEKIYQPETDEISMLIKANGSLRQLVISANPTHPRMHISTQKKENAFNAPAFCMLLRKHLSGAIIKNIDIFNNDRIIRITLDGKNELNESRRIYLIAELMGRYSNIILTNEQMVILDAIRRIHFDQSTTRYILPGLTYTLQPQTRITFDRQEDLKQYFSDHPTDTSEEILKTISGIGKETALEIAAAENRFDALNLFININNSTLYSPCLRMHDNKPVDFFVYPYSTIQTDWVKYPSLNDALDIFYTKYDGEDRKKISAKNVSNILKRLITKNERRISDNLDRLKEWEKAEAIRRKAEILTANLYRINPGEKSVVCIDYYENKEITIELDSALSPSQNAQNYYKRYNKLKRAKDNATAQLDELYQKREYLSTIAVSIENCSLKSEFDEILAELNILGGFSQKQIKKSKVSNSIPTHLVINGFDVYYGKNNQQNAQVTFSIGATNDTWMHAKAHHGTHLIIKSADPDENTLLQCAQLAAFFSDGKSSAKVEVDYTLRKHVKKIPAAMPGLVTYAEYKTILCEPKNFS